ncbi:hypothetical protein D3C83_38830 [compost metagenome]
MKDHAHARAADEPAAVRDDFSQLLEFFHRCGWRDYDIRRIPRRDALAQFRRGIELDGDAHAGRTLEILCNLRHPALHRPRAQNLQFITHHSSLVTRHSSLVTN